MPDTTLRPGEIATCNAVRADATIQFIGSIQTPWPTRDQCPRQGSVDGPECQIHLFKPWDDALDGIDAYERIEVLYWLDHSRRDLLLQSPASDGRVRGTFSLRSPVRPNPIGTSLVVLENRDGNCLTVRGLDCLNGTPLVDLKPDRCAYSPIAPPKHTTDSRQ
ncbi:MAG: tRNA (N6-threonylcarbamoyladenosine(37)-N6)-methyltransferase TrmO [Pseudomonadota bacterium]